MPPDPRLRHRYPPRDAAGAIIPHKLGLPTMLKVAPFLPQFFDKVVPDEFWTALVDDDGNYQVIVVCVCGEETTLSFGGVAECACDRFFMHTGKEVRVGRGVVD